MQDFLIWGALIGAAGALIAIATFWMNRGKAEERAEGAHSIAMAALGKVDLLGVQLSEARIEFARDYASHADLAAADARYAAALDSLRTELRGMNQRLDRILDRFSGQKE